MGQIFTVEVMLTSIPLLCVFQTSPGLLPEAGFSLEGDPMPTVAIMFYSYTKSGKAPAARVRNRAKSDAVSRVRSEGQAV